MTFPANGVPVSDAALPDSTEEIPTGGYLFATFKGETTPLTEQVYFGLSKNGRDWHALNGGEPALISQIGEKGARDPFIVRSHDDSRNWIIATDLSINLDSDWGRAVTQGSRSILIWESSDLVNWHGPRLEEIAAPHAGCTWAPEAVWNEERGEYLVFWASTVANDNFAKHGIWACWTRDFHSFSEPFLWIDNPHDVIDTDIVRENGLYYRFSKDEKNKAITLEFSADLLGQWQEVPNFSLANLHGVEGPQCFRLLDGQWCLLLDYYETNQGYKAFLARDLASGQFTPAPNFSFPFRFRHGSVLPLSDEEYQKLASSPSLAP